MFAVQRRHFASSEPGIEAPEDGAAPVQLPHSEYAVPVDDEWVVEAIGQRKRHVRPLKLAERLRSAPGSAVRMRRAEYPAKAGPEIGRHAGTCS
jgi:hypothetical protein